jgi:hypothetical protein
MFQFSKVYSMNQEVLRKQTHLGNLNVFNDVKCSICKQKGHNKLFCINTEIPRLVDELVEKIYNFVLTNSCTSLSLSLDYISSIPSSIMSQICIYLNTHCNSFHSKKFNIYFKIRKLISKKYNSGLILLNSVQILSFSIKYFESVIIISDIFDVLALKGRIRPFGTII